MTTKTKSTTNLSIPLSALKLISRIPKEKKVIIEINLPALIKNNNTETLDELISSAKLDYATNNYRTFSTANSLIADLHS